MIAVWQNTTYQTKKVRELYTRRQGEKYRLEEEENQSNSRKRKEREEEGEKQEINKFAFDSFDGLGLCENYYLSLNTNGVDFQLDQSHYFPKKYEFLLRSLSDVSLSITSEIDKAVFYLEKNLLFLGKNVRTKRKKTSPSKIIEFLTKK